MADDRLVDLDAARAARWEAKGGERPMKFGGDMFSLPVEVRLEVADLLINGEIKAACLALVGEEQIDMFWSHGPTDGDVVDILRLVYGVELGESVPSPTPLNRAGRRSRATSNGSTRSTSAKSAGESKPSVSDAS